MTDITKLKITGGLLHENGYEYYIDDKHISYKLTTSEVYKKVNHQVTSLHFNATEYYLFLSSWYEKDYPDEYINYLRYKKLKVIQEM
jgi:hypothetical protein